MTEIKMPQLGESITEGTVIRWIRQVGDIVAQYDPILEVETDKVTAEVPAPASGRLAEILVPEGQTVRVGTVIARMAGEDATQPGGDAPALAEAQPAVPASAAPSRAPGSAPISPVVARLLAEHRLDITQIAGTGIGGRVSKQDVLRYLDARPPAMPAAAPAAPPAPPAPVPVATSVAAARPAGDDETDLLPLTPMRRAIAEHLQRSVQIAPHVTSVFEVDMGRVAAHRERTRGDMERQGIRLTFLPYVMQAVARGLRAVPALNGRYSEAGIVVHRRIHLGVAVALDEGLIVPVVRDVEEKSLSGLARAAGELADRARSRQLQHAETQGGTFTITNHGVTGSLWATPIINQPQSGILGVGAIVRRPVVVEHEGLESIAIRPICHLSLTFDHRVCDGADADRFLGTVKRFLEGYAG
jgi:2-oxoisovalerate dehydrogenase E2 component (dihydrolipoyl transacylase)